MPLRRGESSSQLYLVCLTGRARGRALRGSASAVQGERFELRPPLGVRAAGPRDVLPHVARRHDEVCDQAKRAGLPRAPTQGRALLCELVLERL